MKQKYWGSLKSALWFLLVYFLFFYFLFLRDNNMFNSEFSLRSKIHKCCDLYDIRTLVTFMLLTWDLSHVCWELALG